MARVSIELPEHFRYSVDLPIYLLQVNNRNHLDNALLLTLVSEARVGFFESLGFSELDVDGVGIVVADAAVQYRSEAHHGETMRVSMAAAEFWAKGCDLVWRMAEAGSDRLVAFGKTGIVFYDYAEKVSRPVPQAFRDRFS
ncbi:MAG: thioesterase family protein [Rhodocyclaceae bacterium]|nr:thioesterase family protein [Rhodocyclaceae bacterium]